MQQHSTTVMNVRAIENEVGDEIVATQLLESKVYSNGNEECVYATTSFLVLDENNEKVGIEQLAANENVEYGGDTTLSGGNYNLAVSCTAYWIWMNDGNSSYARCTHTTNQVVGNTSGQYYVTQLDCAFKATNDGWCEPIYIDHVYIDYPTPYVVYTAINPRTDFFYDSAYFSEIAAGVVIYYNDGSTYEINIDIKAVAGSEPG